MQFHELKEFLVLSESLNFLEAAEDLFISQATLSKHIKELERTLGAPLFNRSTRKVSLTEFGMRIIPYARQAVKLEEAIQKEIEDYHEWLNNHLIVGCVPHWDTVDLSKMTMDFRQLHPNIHTTLLTDESEELRTSLSQNFSHFAFVRELSREIKDNFERIPICSDPLYAYVPQTHPLARLKSIPITELRDAPLLLGADGAFSYDLAVKACQDAGFKPNILFRGGRPQTFYYLSRGAGLALMFGNPSLSSEMEGIIKLPLEPNIHSYINVLYLKENLTSAGKHFLDFIKNYQFEFVNNI